MTRNHWHFSRPRLAQAYLGSFNLGLSSARGLFARRRMGKTEFLKQDFIPAAEADGYVAIYANLWEMRTEPANALVAAFFQAIEPKGFSKLLQKLKPSVKKIKASGKVAGMAEASLETELQDENKILSGSLLMDAMRAFDQTSIKVVMIIDEAQVLAQESNADFAHALRAALDIRKDRIKVLFAGSSEATLRKMFGKPSEPFYNWAALEPFDLLGQDFVEAMVVKVAGVTKFPLALKDALFAFDELKRTPEFFRRYLDRYLTYPFDGAAGALDYTKNHVFNDLSFLQQWQSMLPADRAILNLIVAGNADPYGKESKEKIGIALGLGKAVANNTIQNALRRLSDQTILTKIDRANYQFEDEAFADWLKHLPE